MANKLVYKVWDKKTEKYLSNGKKSQWNSIGWALNFVKESWYRPRPENVEIHQMELVVKEKYDVKVLLDQMKEDERIKKEKQLAELAVKHERNRKHMNIAIQMSKLLPDVNPITIVQLYKRNSFNTEEMERLKPLIKQWEEA